MVKPSTRSSVYQATDSSFLLNEPLLNSENVIILNLTVLKVSTNSTSTHVSYSVIFCLKSFTKLDCRNRWCSLTYSSDLYLYIHNDFVTKFFVGVGLTVLMKLIPIKPLNINKLWPSKWRALMTVQLHTMCIYY